MICYSEDYLEWERGEQKVMKAEYTEEGKLKIPDGYRKFASGELITKDVWCISYDDVNRRTGKWGKINRPIASPIEHYDARDVCFFIGPKSTPLPSPEGYYKNQLLKESYDV